VYLQAGRGRSKASAGVTKLASARLRSFAQRLALPACHTEAKINPWILQLPFATRRMTGWL